MITYLLILTNANSHLKGLVNRFYRSLLIVSYEVSKSIENCEPSLVVSTKQDCEDASEQLDLSFKFQMDKNTRHAGCYKDGELTYFNKIIIPSDTSPMIGKKARRAICKVTSTESKIISTPFSSSKLSEIII